MSHLRVAFSAALVGLLGTATASAAPPPSYFGVDLYYFVQRDPGIGATFIDGPEKKGGNPLRAEGFDYGAAGLDFRLQVSDEVALRGNAVGGWIRDEGEPPIPETVVDAVTAASPSLTTLDSQLNVEWQPDDGKWQVAPGFFYHHQTRFFVGGPNLDLARQLNDGNTVLFSNLSLRAALVRQRTWRNTKIGDDWRVSANGLLGWTQFWSRSFLTTVSARYTRQSGDLRSRWNYVGIYDQTGRVRELKDEQLPRRRHRGQLALRGRYSWAVGWSIGLDLSAYADTWSIWHGSGELSFEAPLPARIRLRVWYRLSVQDGTKYFVEAPTAVGTYFTQDSDLADFAGHSPGLLMTVPLGGDGLAWELRASAYGIFRSDGLFATGGHVGAQASW